VWRCDQRLAAGIDEWDRDTWLFNIPGGTLVFALHVHIARTASPRWRTPRRAAIAGAGSPSSTP